MLQMFAFYNINTFGVVSNCFILSLLLPPCACDRFFHLFLIENLTAHSDEDYPHFVRLNHVSPYYHVVEH